MTDVPASRDRFFVAGMLPPAECSGLLRLRPPALPGVRPTPADHLHVTLHYVGAGQEQELTAACSTLACDVVPLTLRGVGGFIGADGAINIWAGIELSDELARLHRAVADALSVVGFEPEARPYRPHITLARCTPPFDQRVIDDHHRLGAELGGHMVLRTIALYASTLLDGEPRYRTVLSIPLTAGGVPT